MKLYQIVGNILRIDPATLSPESNAQNTPNWDSLNHIELIFAIESAYCVRFTMPEIASLRKLGDIEKLPPFVRVYRGNLLQGGLSGAQFQRAASIDFNVDGRDEVVAAYRMPDGSLHDGSWYASDVGPAIRGQRVDLFTGMGRASMDPIMHLNTDHLSVVRMGTFEGCPPRD